MGAVVVMGIYPFFVKISAGGLKQRTHLPVRPYITHRGKPPASRGNAPVRGLRGSIEWVKMIAM